MTDQSPETMTVALWINIFISVCQLLEKDVVAVLGVDIGPMDQMVASVLSYVGIPFVQINPRYAHQILILAIPSKANL